MRRKKLIGMLLAAYMLVGSACGGNENKNVYSLSDSIKNVSTIGYVTGRDSLGYTDECGVHGTDLGIPFYNERNGKMYLLFGDTFTLWRSNVMAYSSDFELSDGLKIDGWYANQFGLATAIIEGHHSANDLYYERTKIPQGGIFVNGNMYVYYESIRHWGEAGYWDVNYSGVIKSSDDGQTWERLHDLTWIATDEELYAEKIVELATQDINNENTDYELTIEERLAPYFAQMYPVDGKDGYIYLYGRKGGRQYGIVVGRVLKENIEKFSEHEYLVGTKDGEPNWVKGSEGLKALSESNDAEIIAAPTSNMSVMYNEYLGKWQMTYYLPGNGIVYATADTPYGPYSPCERIFDTTYTFPDNLTGLYGAFTHELYTEQDGKIFYIIVSSGKEPNYNAWMVKVELK